MTALSTLHVSGASVSLRRAVEDDVAEVVALLADDLLGTNREVNEPGDLGPYLHAFHAIDSDPAHLLLVAENKGQVVGTMQISFLPGLARRGALRAQIEAVRVRQDYRDRRLGAAMFEWAINESRQHGCALVQLTTDKARVDAHRFYERLGFVASHDGYKLIF